MIPNLPIPFPLGIMAVTLGNNSDMNMEKMFDTEPEIPSMTQSTKFENWNGKKASLKPKVVPIRSQNLREDFDSYSHGAS